MLHYQRPRGGAGPRLKFDMPSNSKPLDPTSENINVPTSVQHLLGPSMTTEQIAAIVQIVMAVQAQKPATPPRSKKKNVTGTIVEQPNRQRNARTTELVVRNMMTSSKGLLI